MMYGYCRCSTNETKQDIDRQIRELRDCGVDKANVFKEYESGSKIDRVELDRLFNTVKSGDTIVVTEISRLSRSTKQLCQIIEDIQAKQLKLIVKNSITIDCSNGELDPMTKAFLQMAAVFSELEKEMIKSRVKSGMRNAKAKGKQIGRPTLTITDIPSKVKKYYDTYVNGNISKTDYAKMCDISRPTLDKYLSIIESENV